MTFASINPATGEEIGRTAALTEGQLSARLRGCDEAQRRWEAVGIAGRAELVSRLAAHLRSEQERYARLITTEMGKPVRESRAELEKCAWAAAYYAEEAAAWLAPVTVETAALRSEVHYRPLGLVLGIMPWNFPFWQVFRFAVPTLLAGNGVLVKHAPSVQGCAAAIAACFEKAGFPPGLCTNLPITVGQVEQVVADPAVQAVTLTGSGRAGRSVAALAGGYLKMTVLELGGSDPFVVLADADLDRAVDTCLRSRLVNTGQSCIGAKRIIVSRPLYDSFRDRLAKRLSCLVVGDPAAETSDIGPMAGLVYRETLHRQVQESVRLGARCLTGGTVPEGPGAYYPPTLLVDVRPDMPAWQEELFGPVFVLVQADDEAHAIQLANDTPYGLGATIFTGDKDKGYDMACRELAAGSCFVNAMVRSDPRLPFGGIRHSGYGRELSVEGIRTFTNIKTVWLEA